MNALERYRKEHDLTYQGLGDRTDYPTPTVWRHCTQSGPIPGEAALRYHARLGIPLEDLRPDLKEAAPDVCSRQNDAPRSPEKS